MARRGVPAVGWTWAFATLAVGIRDAGTIVGHHDAHPVGLREPGGLHHHLASAPDRLHRVLAPKLDAALHRRDGYPYDYHRLLYTFRVKSRTKEVGIYRPRHTWAFSSTIRLVKT